MNMRHLGRFWVNRVGFGRRRLSSPPPATDFARPARQVRFVPEAAMSPQVASEDTGAALDGVCYRGHRRP
jgi:hypothetical protein